MKRERETVLQVKDLAKQFGDFTAVDGLSFEVGAGEIFGFLGPNGSGKTTTIRMMLGLLPPTRGDVRVLDLDVQDDPHKLRWLVGYMAQRFSLYNDLTVEQNLRFYGQAYGLWGTDLQARIEKLLEMAGLSGRQKVRTDHLSGGWRQRLALSAAIIHQPEVVFLDEPTAGVDPVSRREFWELLYRMASQGVTIFVTTHYMDEAEHCHRLGFLQRGRLMALGTPSSLKQEMMEGSVLELEVDENADAVEILKRASERDEYPLRLLELYGDVIHVVVDQKEGAIEATESLLSEKGIRLDEIRQVEPNLEDVFISCMRDTT